MKIWVRLASFIFCRKIIINDPEKLKINGPVLIASNHPNSFLDAVILDILFKKPIWSLARGDAFKKPFYARLLRRMKMLPVYRSSEGLENLENNYDTFSQCKTIFRENGLVQIFSEGNCFNEWHLRPLKKGTARLAISSWEDGIDLKVLPVGINYSSFKRSGKNVFINFGDFITKENLEREAGEGKKIILFNELLEKELKKTVFEIDPSDITAKQKLRIPVRGFKKIILLLPAIAGLILNCLFYLSAKKFTINIIREKEFHDAVLTGILTLIYPVWVLGISFLVMAITESYWGLLGLVVFPLTAWCFIQLKPQMEELPLSEAKLPIANA